jgi:hypothetical protein
VVIRRGRRVKRGRGLRLGEEVDIAPSYVLTYYREEWVYSSIA